MWMVHSLPRTLQSFSYYHRREKSTPPLLVLCIEYYVLFLAGVVFWPLKEQNTVIWIMLLLDSHTHTRRDERNARHTPAQFGCRRLTSSQKTRETTAGFGGVNNAGCIGDSFSLSAENLFSPFERLADLWRRHLTPAPLTSQPLRPIVGPPAGKCHSAIKGEKKEEQRATLDGVISASLCSMHAAVVCVRLSAVNLSTPRVEEERREIIICWILTGDVTSLRLSSYNWNYLQNQLVWS